MHFSTVDVVTQTRCSWAVCKCVCVCVCLCVGWSLLYVFLQMPLCWYTLSACACNEHFYLFGRGYAELADFFVQEPKSIRKRSKNKNVEKEREVLLLHPNSYPPKATTELKSITHKHTHTHTRRHTSIRRHIHCSGLMLRVIFEILRLKNSAQPSPWSVFELKVSINHSRVLLMLSSESFHAVWFFWSWSTQRVRANDGLNSEILRFHVLTFHTCYILSTEAECCKPTVTPQVQYCIAFSQSNTKSEVNSDKSGNSHH